MRTIFRTLTLILCLIGFYPLTSYAQLTLVNEPDKPL